MIYAGCILFSASVFTTSLIYILSEIKQLQKLSEIIKFIEFYSEMVKTCRMSSAEIIERGKKNYSLLNELEITPENMGYKIQNLISSNSPSFADSYEIISSGSYDKAVNESRLLTDRLNEYYENLKNDFDKKKYGILTIPVLLSALLLLMII